jgi:uncharacterized Zn-binding protein involved in type VI secretion
MLYRRRMSEPVAKRGDRVVGVDTHVVLVPSPGGPVPTPMPMSFDGALVDDLGGSTMIDNQPVALVGSVARNLPPHLPLGGPFQKLPANAGTISQGSSSVFVENRAVARANDPARCCNDPTDQDTAHVIVAAPTVFAG